MRLFSPAKALYRRAGRFSKLHETLGNIIIWAYGANLRARRGGGHVTNAYYNIKPDKDDPLENSGARLLNITWAQYSSEWNSTLHAHRHAEMFFILGGDGSFQLQHDSFPVSSRSLVIINPGVMHCEQSGADSPLEYIVLGVENLEMAANEQGYVLTYFHNDWESVSGILRLMLQEVRAEQEGYPQVCQRMLEIILLRILRRRGLSLASASAGRGDNRECVLVRRYIDEHFKESLNLDQLAELAHINKYYLVHAFRKAYGTSPINYLISRRIQESRFLLTNSDHSLSQIARILGFSSLSYFSQSFRRAEGVSPLEYRRLHTGEDAAGERG